MVSVSEKRFSKQNYAEHYSLLIQVLSLLLSELDRFWKPLYLLHTNNALQKFSATLLLRMCHICPGPDYVNNILEEKLFLARFPDKPNFPAFFNPDHWFF